MREDSGKMKYRQKSCRKIQNNIVIKRKLSHKKQTIIASSFLLQYSLK